MISMVGFAALIAPIAVCLEDSMPVKTKVIVSVAAVGTLLFIAWVLWYRKKDDGKDVVSAGKLFSLSSWIWSIILVVFGLVMLSWIAYRMFVLKDVPLSDLPYPQLVIAGGAIYLGIQKIVVLVRIQKLKNGAN